MNQSAYFTPFRPPDPARAGGCSTATLVLFMLAMAWPALTFADALLTVTCPAPKGTTTQYGASKGASKGNALKVWPNDSLPDKPTFVIDSSRRRVTTVWSERNEDAKRREEAGVKQPRPSLATDAEIVAFDPDVISAVQNELYGVKLISLYPKLGVVFVTVQGVILPTKNANQISTFAECTFIWSGPH